MKQILQKLIDQHDLIQDEVDQVVLAMKENQISDIQIAGFLVSLLMKGPTTPEVTAIARAMRNNCVPIRPRVGNGT